MLDQLHALATAWVEQWGLWGLFAGMLLESACVPIPSEVLMPLGGYLAHQGHFPLWLAVIVGALGNLAGSMLAWAVARYGRDSYLHYLKNPRARHHLEIAQRWFERRGLAAAFFGRLLPIVRTYISLPAGFFKAAPLPFAVLTFAGSLIWSWALAALGYWLGGHWEDVEVWGKPLSLLVALGIIVLAWRWWRSLRRDPSKG